MPEDYGYGGENMKLSKRMKQAGIALGLLVLAIMVVPGVRFGRGKSPDTVPAGSSASARSRALEVIGSLPLHFEENRGQADRQVKYLSRGKGYNLFLTSTGSVLALTRSSGETGPPARPE